jgi:hypothetical protein
MLVEAADHLDVHILCLVTAGMYTECGVWMGGRECVECYTVQTVPHGMVLYCTGGDGASAFIGRPVVRQPMQQCVIWCATVWCEYSNISFVLATPSYTAVQCTVIHSSTWHYYIVLLHTVPHHSSCRPICKIKVVLHTFNQAGIKGYTTTVQTHIPFTLTFAGTLTTSGTSGTTNTTPTTYRLCNGDAELHGETVAVVSVCVGGVYVYMSHSSHRTQLGLATIQAVVCGRYRSHVPIGVGGKML